MPVLTDVEIQELISRNELVERNYSEKGLTPNGYDITVEHVKTEDIPDPAENVVVKPMQVFWASSREVFNFPDNVIGQIWIRSSYARRGILGSFGLIDAGFRGTLTLTFFNGSGKELVVSAGDRVAQLIFVALNSRAEKNYASRSGNYQGKEGMIL